MSKLYFICVSAFFQSCLSFHSVMSKPSFSHVKAFFQSYHILFNLCIINHSIVFQVSFSHVPAFFQLSFSHAWFFSSSLISAFFICVSSCLSAFFQFCHNFLVLTSFHICSSFLAGVSQLSVSCISYLFHSCLIFLVVMAQHFFSRIMLPSSCVSASSRMSPSKSTSIFSFGFRPQISGQQGTCACFKGFVKTWGSGRAGFLQLAYCEVYSKHTTEFLLKTRKYTLSLYQNGTIYFLVSLAPIIICCLCPCQLCKERTRYVRG